MTDNHIPQSGATPFSTYFFIQGWLLFIAGNFSTLDVLQYIFYILSIISVSIIIVLNGGKLYSKIKSWLK